MGQSTVLNGMLSRAGGTGGTHLLINTPSPNKNKTNNELLLFEKSLNLCYGIGIFLVLLIFIMKISREKKVKNTMPFSDDTVILNRMYSKNLKIQIYVLY